ncbi:MAG: tyrosine-protein phosphatase [Chlamydiales bacterium]|nr:tyrosine-protein phosphatase [Chlamydiales bacterium]
MSLRVLTSFRGEGDTCQALGQILAYPLLLATEKNGRSYQVLESTIERLPESSITKKVVVIFFATVFLPVTLVIVPLGLILMHYSKTHQALFHRVQEECQKAMLSLKQFYTRNSQPPLSTDPFFYSIIDCAVAPQLPKAHIQEKLATTAQSFKERWNIFSKGRTFMPFQLNREDQSLEREFMDTRYMRRKEWFQNPEKIIKESKPDYTVAHSLLFADGARSRDCMAFAYNHTGTAYNASIMHLNGNRYIACEGPSKRNVFKFFQTLMAYQVTHLVRLTADKEGETAKCHPYWQGLQTEQDGITMLNLPVSVPTNNDHSYAVQAFDMEGWRDNQGFNPKELLDVVLAVRKSVKESNGLLAIHCSAGVGRTGTFMAALSIVDAIDERKAFSIQELVCKLSLQRFHSVGKPSQYITLHRLAEAYIESLTSAEI